MTFEETGIDTLFVDEAHGFKDVCYRGSFGKGTQQNNATALFAVHSEDCVRGIEYQLHLLILRFGYADLKAEQQVQEIKEKGVGV